MPLPMQNEQDEGEHKIPFGEHFPNRVFTFLSLIVKSG